MQTRTTTVPAARPVSRRQAAPRTPNEPLRRALLICGVLSSVYYLAMNAYVPLRWEGYSVTSQVISELSAVDAPTRTLWVLLSIPYSVLLIAFGWGVWFSAGPSRALRLTGVLFAANGAVGAFWPPMHLRGAEHTLTDTLHIAWAAVWLLIMLLAMALAAAGLGRRFRLYTLATVVTFLVFGALTGIDGPKIAADLPTPWVGLWERINIGVGMLWLAGLAFVLLRGNGRARLAPDARGSVAASASAGSP